MASDRFTLESVFECRCLLALDDSLGRRTNFVPVVPGLLTDGLVGVRRVHRPSKGQNHQGTMWIERVSRDHLLSLCGAHPCLEHAAVPFSTKGWS